MKRAARYVLRPPRAAGPAVALKDGDDQGIARSDIDLAEESGATVGTSSTGSAGSSAARNDELSALQTLLAGFDGINRWTNGIIPPDKVLGREELERAASDADASPSLKRALRYVLDHPTVLGRLSRSTGFGVMGIFAEQSPARIEDARRGASTSATKDQPTKTITGPEDRPPTSTSSRDQEQVHEQPEHRIP